MKFTAPKGKKLCGIYQITNLIDGKCYYGQSDDIRRRFRDHYQHLMKGNHDNQRLQHAFNKHGSDAFEMKVFELLTTNQLNVAEQLLLDEHAGKEHCYNIMRSVEQTFRGQKHSPEALEKMSKTWFGKGENHVNFGKHLSDDIRQKISEGHRGKVLSEETKKKLSDLNSSNPNLNRTGHQHSQETIEKIRKARSRQIFTDETRRKMSEVRQGIKHPMFGKMLTEDTKTKIKFALSKPVIQKTKNGNIIQFFHSAKEASIKTNISHSNIIHCCKGTRKTAGKYKWEYDGNTDK